jgi:hypothetical protein
MPGNPRWSVHGPLTGGAGIGGTLANLQTSTFSSFSGTGAANLYGAAIATGFMG